jgi:uncharacterized protein (UPF0210 family)
MIIRSITYFLDPGWPIDRKALERAGKFVQEAHAAYEAAGYQVQSHRLATIPFPHLLPDGHLGRLLELAQALEQAAGEQGFAYVSVGPALPEAIWSYAAIPDLLAGTQNVFASGIMTGFTSVFLPGVRACARVIHEAASISPDGFANLRFAALANVPPGSPFFPAAYHHGKEPAFALALEPADLAVEAFSRAADLEDARRRLIAAVEAQAQKLVGATSALHSPNEVLFNGIDFSLAPFPETQRSLGEAIERLGVPAVGYYGSLAASAFIGSCLTAAHFPRTGFSGLMLPVLEDAVLAKRAGQGILSVKDLLLYSAVCGTGLDCVPLPGDATPEQLTAVLLDLAALAMRLDKPLTARLMPIPGKQAGDPTDFDFAYFANSRVISLEAGPLEGLLGEGTILPIEPRNRQS